MSASGDGISVEFGGLAEGGRLTAGGGPVDFSVTFTNNSGHTLAGVAPVVAAQPFDGARCKLIEGTAAGTLQREDGSGWTDLPISQGTGMDYATTGDKATFTMAPGASRTVQYRVQLSADNGPAPLAIEADAYLRPGASFRAVGRALRHLTVVDPHRPTASMPSMTPIPTSVTAGGASVEVEVSPGNFTGTPFASAAPLLTLGATQTLPYSDTDLNPKDVTAEVMVNGGWKSLPVQDYCGNATVDTSSLAGPLSTGHVVNYLFRFTVAKTLPTGIASLDLSAGAVADGHYAAPVSTKVAVKR